MTGPRRTARKSAARRAPARPGARARRTAALIRTRSRAPTPLPEQAARQRAARRTTLTGRAAILAAVVAVLAMSLAYPLRQYLGQRAEIGRLEERVREQEHLVDELTAERERWSDPAYIEAQARERLHYCLPQETCYVTVDGQTPTPTAAPTDAQPTPWFARLWESVEDAADQDPP